MSDVSEFLEHHDKLVIKDVVTSHYQLMNIGTDEMWGTFAAPALESLDLIESAIGDVPHQLPTGKHHLRLQAVGADGAIRGQIGFSVDGRSAHVKSAMTDHMALQKAVRMNVETSETQLSTMSIRQQQAEERALTAERRMAENASAVMEMQGLVSKMLNDQEKHDLEVYERRARADALKEFALMFKPAVPMLMNFGISYMNHKQKDWQAKAEESEARKARAQESHHSPSPEEDSSEEKTH